jgi:hypothetical protein
MILQTEFEFTLPKGYIDKAGNLHRTGIMRLANANDEIKPLADPRVKNNNAYIVVILLSRVITRLGTLTLTDIKEDVIENLFAADLAYLQDFYYRINSNGSARVTILCPHCEQEFEMDEALLNGGTGLEG